MNSRKSCLKLDNPVQEVCRSMCRSCLHGAKKYSLSHTLRTQDVAKKVTTSIENHNLNTAFPHSKYFSFQAVKFSSLDLNLYTKNTAPTTTIFNILVTLKNNLSINKQIICPKILSSQEARFLC